MHVFLVISIRLVIIILIRIIRLVWFLHEHVFIGKIFTFVVSPLKVKIILKIHWHT
jgi:hypothetical protein